MAKYSKLLNTFAEALAEAVEGAATQLNSAADKISPRLKYTSQSTDLTYATKGASAFDLPAFEEVVIQPGAGAIVRTGVAFSVPDGYELQIRGRSGMAFGSDVVCHFGTVDSDYTGEVRVKLWNLGDKPYHVMAGNRIAQAVFAPVSRPEMQRVGVVDKQTERGTKGFGHTGV